MGRMARLCVTATAITLLNVLASAPAAAGDEPMLPAEVFHQIFQNLVDAENRGDTAAMAALFAEGAVLMPPGAKEPIQGRDGIRRFLDEYAKHKMDNRKITPTALMIGGPKTMIDAGIWSGDVPAQNGAQAASVTGTYLAVGVLVDQRWKLWAVSWQASDSGAFGSSTPQVGTSTPNK